MGDGPMTDIDKLAQIACEAFHGENTWDYTAAAHNSWRRAVQAVIDALGLEVDEHPNVPISVPEFNEDGSPVMDERMCPPVQRRHFEWVTKRRWVTLWEEVGPRETSEQLSARLEALRDE